MVLDSIYLLMEMYIKVNLKMEIDKDREAILGQTKVTIKESGLLIK